MTLSHGLFRGGVIPEYSIWKHMKRRCYSEKDRAYKWYGGKGISVCETWLASFPAFMADMGPRPKGFSLDRIDNSKDYSPENCRWVPLREQHRNTTRNRILTAFGESMILTDWCRKLGVYHATIREHLENGLTMEQICLKLAGRKPTEKQGPRYAV